MRFAIAEQSLKSSRLLKNKRPAEADWHQLANRLGEKFFESIKLSKRAEALIHEPPRKRLAEGFRWHPEQPAPLTSVEQLLVNGVCQVRNNLVHGEKFAVDGLSWGRDLALVSESLMVLRLAMSRFEASA